MHPLAKQVIECAQQASSSDPTAKESPLPIAVPSPWSLWLLMSLVRQVERQRWVSTILASKLGVDMDAMSVAGAMAQPPVAQLGPVPGYSDWEYYFHGRGCCLSNRITGESIDVDFYDGISDWIDDFFFVCFLESLKAPEPIEQRLIELHPAIQTVGLGIEQLLEEGLLERHPDSRVFKPSDEFQRLADEIEIVNTALGTESTRKSVANHFGDWLLASKLLGASPTAHELTAHCISERRKYLESKFAEPKSERLALMALCDLAPDSREYLISAFEKMPSGTTSAALDIVSRRPDDDWSAPVLALMRRTDPRGDLPQPYTWTKCAEYLLRRGVHIDEVRSQFAGVGRRCLGDAAILGLEYFPDLAVGLFRGALRSDVPIDRITASAALAILDQPWSHNLLLEILEATTDQEATSETRAALMATRHPHLHEAVGQWEQANPHEPEHGPFITMTEMSLRNRDSRIQQEIEKLHDRVILLRSIIPPEAPTPQSPKRRRPF